MKLIGFNLTKIKAERNETFKSCPININAEFKDISKEKLDLLKDEDVIKFTFNFTISYLESESKKESTQGKIEFEGSIIFAVEKEESKEILKSWKKKEIPPNTKQGIINLILRKCAARSLSLQDDLALPSHIQIPQISQKPQQ